MKTRKGIKVLLYLGQDARLLSVGANVTADPKIRLTRCGNTASTSVIATGHEGMLILSFKLNRSENVLYLYIYFSVILATIQISRFIYWINSQDLESDEEKHTLI